jgi:hypothetical protein
MTLRSEIRIPGCPPVTSWRVHARLRNHPPSYDIFVLNVYLSHVDGYLSDIRCDSWRTRMCTLYRDLNVQLDPSMVSL